MGPRSTLWGNFEKKERKGSRLSKNRHGQRKKVTPVRAFVSHLKVLGDIETKEAISGVVREPDLSPLGSPCSWLLLGATTNNVRDPNLW